MQISLIPKSWTHDYPEFPQFDIFDITGNKDI